MAIVTNKYFLIFFYISSSLVLFNVGAFEYLHAFFRQHETWELDEFALSLIPMLLALSLYTYGKYTEASKSKKAVIAMLYTDLPSGLPNKVSFEEAIKTKAVTTVILLKITNYQSISAAFGVNFTDSIIGSACHTIRQAVKLEFACEVYRLDGNLFGVALADEFTSSAEQTTLLNKINAIQDKFNETLIGDGYQKIYLTLTCGFSNTHPILHTANIALEYASNHSSLIIQEYTPEIVDVKYNLEKVSLLTIISRAIKKDLVGLCFQPIIDNKTNTIVKYEVLMRLFDQDGLPISPMKFLPLAKTLKLYPLLTRAVIAKSFDYFSDKPVAFSLNLSWLDITNTQTMEYFFARIEASPSCAKRLTIEILESEECVHRPLVEFRRKLKTYGIKLAIDDFGVGYSNLGLLRDLSPDYLKIDGSLIQQLDSNTEIRMAVEAISTVAKAHNILTVAEYVSTEKIHALVCDLKIDMSQGYWFSPPIKDLLPANTFVQKYHQEVPRIGHFDLA